MISHHNRQTLIETINKQKGWEIKYLSFWKWEKLGYIKPDAFLPDGKRLIPIYYQDSVEKIIKKLEELEKNRKIRIKKYVTQK